MADATRYINSASPAGGNGTTDSITGGDADRAYNSLTEWETDEDGLADNDSVQTVYISGTQTLTADFDLAGWGTGIEIVFEAISGEESQAQKSGAQIDMATYQITWNGPDIVRFKNLYIQCTRGFGSINTFFGWDDYDVFDSCYLYINSLVMVNSTVGTLLKMVNTIYEENTGSGAFSFNNDTDNSSDTAIWNCGFILTDKISKITDETGQIYNSWIQTSDAFDPMSWYTNVFFYLDNCTLQEASDSAEWTTATSCNFSHDFSSDFVDSANDDYQLDGGEGSDIINAGLGTSSGAPSVDANGVSRDSGSCDIGPFEYVSGGASPFFIPSRRQFN